MGGRRYLLRELVYNGNVLRGSLDVILIQQRYAPPDPARQAELERARSINAACKAIDRIVFVEGETKRWTFADFFDLAARDFPGELCVVSNSDVSFDESLALAAGLFESPRVLLALTRWDDDVAPSMEGRIDTRTWRFYSQSQDAWVFRAGGLPRFEAGFRLGVPRCENRLAFEAARAGILVMNPALSIRVQHHHATNLRTWRRGDDYRGPLLFPRLTTIDGGSAEGLVLHRRLRKQEAVVTLGDGARVEAAATAPVRMRDLWRMRIGMRSPLYVRSRR